MKKPKKVSVHHHERVKDHAKALISATSHIADNKVAEARNKLSEVMETIGEAIEDVEETALEKAKQADHYVRQNPYQAVGIGIGLGALIGFFMARRK